MQATLPIAVRQQFQTHIALCKNYVEDCRSFQEFCDFRYVEIVRSLDKAEEDETEKGKSGQSHDDIPDFDKSLALKRPSLSAGVANVLLPALVGVIEDAVKDKEHGACKKGPPPGFCAASSRAGNTLQGNAFSRASTSDVGVVPPACIAGNSSRTDAAIANYVTQMSSIAGRISAGTSGQQDPSSFPANKVDPTKAKYKALIEQICRALPCLTQKEALNYLIRVRIHHNGSLSGLTVPYIIREVARCIPHQTEGGGDDPLRNVVATKRRDGTVEEEVTRYVVI